MLFSFFSTWYTNLNIVSEKTTQLTIKSQFHFQKPLLLLQFTIKQNTLLLKKLQNYKPDSVSNPKAEWLSFIWDAAHATPQAANPQTSDEPPSIACLFGISARKVYPYTLSPIYIVVSYTTFSPLPRKSGAVIFCGTICQLHLSRNAYPLGSALPYTVRTFLREHKAPGDNPLCSSSKINNFLLKTTAPPHKIVLNYL